MDAWSTTAFPVQFIEDVPAYSPCDSTARSGWWGICLADEDIQVQGTAGASPKLRSSQWQRQDPQQAGPDVSSHVFITVLCGRPSGPLPQRTPAWRFWVSDRVPPILGQHPQLSQTFTQQPLSHRTRGFNFPQRGVERLDARLLTHQRANT